MQRVKSVQKIGLSIGLTLLAAGNPVTVSLAVGAIATLSVPAAQAAVLTSWRFDPATRQLEITVPEGVTPRYFLLAQPARIVLDLPNTDVGAVQELQTFSGPIRQVRVGQFQDGLTRIVLELSPDAVLASGQAELRRADGSSSGPGDRWILRPLLAGDNTVATRPASPPPAETPALPPVAPQAAQEPVPIQPAPVEPPPAAEPIPEASDETPLSTSLPLPGTPADGADDLPPLEPDATVIPVEPPEAVTEAEPVPAPVFPQAASPDVSVAEPTAEPTPAPRPAVPARPESDSAVAPPAPSASPLATGLPPAILPGDRPVTVTVPSPDSSPAAQAPSQRAQPAAPIAVQPSVTTLPPAIATAPSSSVAVPPPQSLPSRPLPPPTVEAQPQAAAPTAVGILIPSGTVLSLRYPRDTILALQEDSSWQEVLVLTQELRDRSGNVIAPEGSQVIGRFETKGGASRFVAQAISLQGQNVRLAAQSEVLVGDPQVSEDDVVRNSAIGGLALTLLGAFTGIGLIAGAVAGAAAGAATTYIAAPQPATIEPNQIVEVRLTEDLARQ